MTISVTELRSIEKLAYLETNPLEMDALAKEITSIIDFVHQLREINTTGIAPLFHPLDLHQPLRDDIVTEEDCLAELAQIAPFFEEGLYFVPKVIDAGNE